MNEFVRIAQVTTASGSGSNETAGDAAVPIALSKPSEQQSVVSLRLPGQLVDFRQILNEDISFIRIGDDLQMIFTDGGIIIVQNFFLGDSGSQVALVGEEQALSIGEFTSVANLETAEGIQTAAGETTNLATALGGPQGSGQNFQDPNIDGLGGGTNTLDLLNGDGAGDGGGASRVFVDGEVDTVPTIDSSAEAGFLDEGNLTEGNEAGEGSLTATGSLGINFGENAGPSPSLTFDTNGAGIPLDASGSPLDLSSDGVALTYTIVDNADGGQTLTAAKEGTGEVVFTVLLDIVPGVFAGGASGAVYTFTLIGNLDHLTAATDLELPVSFSVTAEDTDGDSIGTSFTVTVTDDDAEIGVAEDSSVDEEGLTGGNVDSGYDGDLAGDAVTASGDLAISWGADNANPTSGGGTGDRSVAFDTDQPGLEGLTSNGDDISVTILADGTLVGYTGSTVPTSTGDTGVVFFATLSDEDTGSYAFTLAGNLDHPDADTEDDLDLTFAFTATDGDGDTASSTFTVTVDDDAPVIGETTASAWFDQDFETATDAESASMGDSSNGWYGSVQVVADGYDGINTPDGSGHYAILTQSGTAGDETGPFSRFDDYKTEFLDGFTASVNIYLDTSWSLGEGFDYSVSANGQDGAHQRDFIFHVTKDTSTGELLVGASNNTNFDPREDLETINHGTITTSGWYTFEHSFEDAGDGTLAVVMTIYDSAGNVVLTETRNTTLDTLSTEVGGNRYAWFTNIDVAGGIAVDNLKLESSAGVAIVNEDDLSNGTDDAPEALVATGDLGIDWGADDGNNGSGGLGDRTLTFDVTEGDSGLTSNGATVYYTLSTDGTLLTAHTGTGVGDIDDVIFTVELNDDDTGSYTFTLAGNIDHPESGQDLEVLTFGFTATDGDGDTASSTFTVTVDDDAPVIGDAEATSVDEEGLDGGNVDSGYDGDLDGSEITSSGSLAISWGADDGNSNAGGNGDRSVAFDTDQPGLEGLTSNGDDISVTILGNGTLVGYTGSTVPNGTGEDSVVFYATLSDADSGSYVFTLAGNLDHPEADTEDDLDLTFAFTATDSDGDTASSTFTVTVDDDAPVEGDPETTDFDAETLTHSTFESGTVDLRIPETQSAGIIESTLDVPTGGSITDLNISIDLLHTYMADLTITLIAPDGTEVTLVQNNGGHGDPDGVMTFDDEATEAFPSGGSGAPYVGTWQPAVDELAKLDGLDMEGTWTLRITDGTDGDVGRLRSWSLEIEGPVTATMQVNAVVDEDDLSTVNGDEVDGNGDSASSDDDTFSDSTLDTDVDGSTVYGDLAISWGADDANDVGDGGITGLDGDRSVSFAATTISALEDLGLTSRGDAVTYALSANDTVLTASADGRVVFTVSLSDLESGSFKFDLNDVLDHSAGGDENNIVLPFGYVAVDSDGDSFTSSFTVGVDDDMPTIGDAENSSVDEEGLDGGNVESGYDGDLTGSALTASGDLAISWGADDTNPTDGGGAGDRSVIFSDAQPGLDGLTSNGLSVSFVILSDGTLVGYTGDTEPAATGDSGVVFFATLSDAGSGSYEFALVDNLDHPTANTEDDLDLTFAFTAKDSDLDWASSTFTVTVDDDAPAAGTVESVTVDEDDIFNFSSVGTSPWDTADDDGSTTGATDLFGPAYAAGSLASTVAFGADGAAASGGFAFTSTAADDMAALGLTSKGEALSFTVATIFGETFLVGYVDNGNGLFNALADRRVISVQLDSDGDYVVRLHDQLDHEYGDGTDDPTLVAGAGTIDAIDFGAVIEATDYDGDTITLDGLFEVTVTDDVPEPEAWVDDYVRIDETYGDHSDNVYNPGTGEYNPNVVALFSGVTETGSDSDLPGPIYARYNVIDYDANVGADEDATVEMAFQIDDSDSGLFTTENEAIELSIEGDLVVGRIGSGEAVFAIHIDDAGLISIVQYQSLYHDDPTSSDEHISLADKVSVVVTVTDADGDTVSTVVPIGEDVITFDDDGPDAYGLGSGLETDEASQIGSTLAGQLQFDGGADGATVTDVSLVMNGVYVLGLDREETGAARRGNLTVDGQNVTVSQSTDANGVITVNGYLEGTATLAFQIVVQPDGNYTFQQLLAFDHPDANETGSDDQLGLRLRFTVTDGDGDTDTARALILINDDGPSIGDVTDGTVDEDGLPDGLGDSATGDATDDNADGDNDETTFTGDLGIDWGVDDYDTDGAAGVDDGHGRSVSFASSLDGATPAGLMSDGEQVVYTLSNNGTLLTATKEISGTTVFTVALDDDGAGSYTFTLLDNLDHDSGSDENDIDLTFDFVATDSDGDEAGDSFTVTVDDDAPDARWAGSHIAVDEATELTTEISGQLQFLAGADGATVTDASMASAGGYVRRFDQEEPAGSQRGDLLVDGARVTQTITTDPVTKVITIDGAVEGTGTPVFQIVIDPDGSYTYEQFVAFDHPDENETGADDIIALRIDFTVTDGDGDTDSAGAYIRVSDDGPVQTGDGNHNVVPDEDDIVEIDGVQGAGTDGNDATQFTGTISKVDFGEDGFGSIAFSGVFQVPNENSGALTVNDTVGADSGLTSDGRAVYFRLVNDGQTIEAYVRAVDNGGVEEAIFDAALNGTDRGYTVNLYGNIDHQPGDTDRGAAQSINFDVRATDGDGDYIDVNLSIRIADDAPVIVGPEDSSIDGDVLLTADGSDDTVNGSLNIDFGADDGNTDAGQPGDRSVNFTDTTAGNNVTVELSGTTTAVTLTSNGLTVQYGFDGTTLVGYTGADVDDGRVFTVSLDDTDGSYEFTLLANVDYDGMTSATDNVFDLTFDFTAADSDGDTVSNDFTVTVDDTAPVRVFDGSGELVGTYDTIQEGIDNSLDGYQVLVLPGTYNENLTIDVSIELVSLGGRDVTTIVGDVSGSENATVTVKAGVDDVSIGTDGTDGFTMIGFDKGNPAVEQSVVYLLKDASGDPTENFHLIGNELQANGEAALLSDWNAPIIDAVIDGNIFSGQTFIGTEPATGNQFIVDNVARQLIAFGQGSDPATNLADGIEFTDNQITGTAGGTSAGANLVTIDAANSIISGNTFTGYTNGGAVALRTRGPNTSIVDNILDHTSGGNSAGMSVNNQGTPGTYSGNELRGGDGNEYVTGMTPGDDLVIGGLGNDVLEAGAGADIFDAGGGDDVVIWRVGDGNDLIDGGAEDTADTLRVYSTAAGQEITLDAPGDNNDGFTVASNGETADVDGIEEVEVDFTAGSGTLNVTSDFVNSGVNVNTITVTGGDGNDVVNAGGMTGTDPDSKVGIDFYGNGGNDTFTSGRGDDTFDGGEGTDTFVLNGERDSYTVTVNDDGSVTIVDTQPGVDGDDGTDTATSSVEMLQFGDTAIDLTAAVLVFEGSSNVLRASYDTIQEAIDAGSTVDGDTLRISAGAFDEQVDVTKSLTLIGAGDGSDIANNTVLAGPGKGSELGIEILADDVTIQNLRIEGYDYGISLGDGYTNVTVDGVTATGNDVGLRSASFVQFDGITVTDSHFDGNDYGFYFANDGNGSRIQNVTVSNTSFDGNLNAAIYGETLEGATFTDITAIGSGTGSANGVVFDFWTGYDSTFADITFDGFTIDNSGTTPASAAFRFSGFGAATDPTGITLQNGSVENVARVLRTSEPESAFTISDVTIGTLDGTFNTPNGPMGPVVSVIEGDFGSDTLSGDRFSSEDNDVIYGDFYDSFVGDAYDSFFTSHGATNVDAGDDVIDGGGGDDVIFGGGGNDTLRGGTGADYIEGEDGEDDISGGTGNDVLIGGTGDDSLSGDAGEDVIYGNDTDITQDVNRLAQEGESDVAVFDGTADDYNVTRETDGSWRVEEKSTGETDTLYGIEGIDFGGDGVDLDLTFAVQVFNADNELVGTYETIQEGVNAAGDGFRVEIAAGVYEEQVEIDGKTNITIVGEGDVTIVRMPDTPEFVNDTSGLSKDRVAVISVEGSTGITIQNLTVDGNDLGDEMPASANRTDFEGVYFGNSSGTIEGITVIGVRDEPNPNGTPKGNQRGNAIVVLNDDVASPNTVNILNNEISDFQKTGIVASGEGLTVLIDGNEIEGAGFLEAANAIAQNGIQVSYGADGTVSNNTVTEIGYQRGDWVTSGVLAYEAADGIEIIGNIFVGPVDGSGDPIDNTHYAIFIVGETDNPVVTGNSFEGVLVGVATAYNVDDPVISGNTFANMIEEIVTITGDGTFEGHNLEIYGDANDTALNLTGTTGPDYIEGTDYNDVLDGSQGSDELHGGEGNDIINGGQGEDVIFGDAGEDTLNGGNNSDEIHGGEDADDISGGSGGDELFGDAGDDDLTGGTGDDTIDGGEDIDTAHYSDPLSSADITDNGGSWSVTTANQGTDTLTNVEFVLDGAGNRYLLVGNGGFETIQAAVDAAEEGDTILIATGTWSGAGNENVTIDKPVTIVGSGSVTVDATGSAYGFNIDLDADYASGTVRFENIAVENATNAGINAGDTHILDSLELEGVSLNGNGTFGLYVTGRTETSGQTGGGFEQGGVQELLVSNSGFDGNGTSGSNGSGDIVLFEFDGDATFSGVTISGSTGGTANTAIQIAGFDASTFLSDYETSGVYSYDVLTPMGTVIFEDVAITGDYSKLGVYIQGFTDMTGLEFRESTSASGTPGTVIDVTAGWGVGLGIDPMADQLPTGTPGTPGNAGSFFNEANANGSVDLTYVSVADAGGTVTTFVDGTTKDDTIIGTSGSDAITGFEGVDTIDSGDGDDVITWRTGDGNDLVDGGEETSADTLEVVNTTGGPVAFNISVATGADVIAPATDDILVSVGSETVRIDEIEDINVTFGDAGDTVTMSGDFSTTALATSTITVQGGAGNDKVDANAISSGHRVVFHGNGGNDIFVSGGGDDYFSGGEGDDTYIAGGYSTDYQITVAADGTVTIAGSGGTDTADSSVEFLQFEDVTLDLTQPVHLYNEFDSLVGTYATVQEAHDAASAGYRINLAGTVTGVSLTITKENLRIEGQAGDTGNIFTLSAGILALTLLGDAPFEVIGNNSANVIHGNDGANVITGGRGDDELNGGEGSDTYKVSGTNHGYDTYADSGLSGSDTIQAVSNSTRIGLAGDFNNATSSGIDLIDGTGYTNVSIRGDDDGNTLDFSDVELKNIAYVDGQKGDDTIYGSDGDDVIRGGQGDDILDGGEGSDIYQVSGTNQGYDTYLDTGSASDTDTIQAISNNTRIGLKGDFNFGTDSGIEVIDGTGYTGVSIRGDNDSNTLNFASVELENIAYIDGQKGNDTIIGSAGDDTIRGSQGNDILIGGEGSDTYQVSGTGHGYDTYTDTGSTDDTDTIQAISDNTRIGLLGNFNSGTDSGIEAIDGNGFDGVSVRGDDNSNTLDFSGVALSDIAYIEGQKGDDTIIGSLGGDTIRGSQGDDILDGGEGSDIYQVSGTGHGYDTYADSGSAGDTDTIQAISNNTRIGLNGDFDAASSGIEVIDANGYTGVSVRGTSVANDLDFRNIQLINGITVDAQGGDDTVTTSQTTSEHVLYRGGSGTDTLRIALTLDQAADSALIAEIDAVIANGSGTVNTGGLNFTAEQFETIIKGVTVGDSFLPFDKVLIGDWQNNTLDVEALIGPTSDAYLIFGRGGADTITGSNGNDIIVGESSNDIMDGGEGNDTFLVGAGDGDDTFNGGNGIDRILATEDGTEIGIYDDISVSEIEEISANGFSGVEVHGSWRNNVLDFSGITLDGIEKIDGEGGGDTITGTAFADTIVGGAANDTLNGGGGNDTFEVGQGDGDDTFNGDGGYDRIVATEDNVEIGIYDTISAGEIEEISANGFSGVEVHGNWRNNVLDFSGITLDGIDTFDGEGGSDTITGTAFADTIIGGAANDTLNGGEGNDTFEVGLGDGDDVFNGDGGYDRVIATESDIEIGLYGNFSAGQVEEISANGFDNVEVHGNWQNNTLDFSGTTLTDIKAIDGEGGNDVITGSAIGDTIFGGSGRDTLIGGGGDDTLAGGTGNDTVYGNGTDTGVADNVYAVSGEADVAVFDGDQADYDITRNSDGSWEVTDRTSGESDTLYGIEGIDFGGDGVDVDLTLGVSLFDAGGVLLGTFATIQAAVDASAARGLSTDVIELGAGTYTGNVTIGHTVEIRGANAGTSGNDAARDLTGGDGESTIAGGIVVLGDDVTIDGVRVLDGAKVSSAFELAGIHVQADNVTVTNSVFYRSGDVDADASRGIVHSVTSGDGLTVTDNAFSGWHTGTYVNGGTDVTVEGNLYEGNLVGMSLDAYDGATGLSVTGNTFTNQALEGMGIGSVGGASWEGAISGNEFTGPGVFNYDASLDVDLVAGNTFYGTAGSDVLTDDATDSGRIGANTLIGGEGDDVYLVKGNDTVVEAAGEGIDEVRTADSYTLPDNVEKLTLLNEGISSTENFESFDLGPITDGENDWFVKGNAPRDQEVIDDGGNRVFKMSSDPSSGDFAGPYSAALAATAGEPGTSADYNGQTIKFSFKPVDITGDNSRLEVDFGNDDGSDRNNFMVLEATATGIRIAVNEPELDGNWTNNTFDAFTGNVTLIDGVSLTEWHDIELRLTYNEGPDNDVIEVFLDGQHIGTTTTFENYWDAVGGEHADNAEANQTSRVFFRPSAGSAADDNDGPGGVNEGFLFDDLEVSVHNNSSATGNDLGNVITGNDGDNVILGLGGEDILAGGLGYDKLTGGDDADTFVLESLAHADLITDYDFDTDGDKVDIGNLLNLAFGAGDIDTADAGEYVRVVDTGDGNAALQVDVDGGADSWQDAAVLEHVSMGDTIRVVLDSDGTETNVHAA